MPTGPRIRTDNVFGTTTDNPLLIGATTMNSAGLANLAAVSSAHAIIILDPLRAAGAPEIVVVTAHTASATSATITRGAYGSTARQHAAGTLWVHAPTREDFIQILTSSTRPTDPYKGQLIFETDTNKFVGYTGTDWASRDSGGQLNYAQVTANQTGITTSEVDLTSLTVTVTVATSRRIRIHGHVLWATTAGTPTLAVTRIKESTTVLNEGAETPNANGISSDAFAVLTPSVGSHTYKLAALTDTGTVSLVASTTRPAFILVEDIGAA